MSASSAPHLSPLHSHFKEEAFFYPLVLVSLYLCFFVLSCFFRWIVNVCMANFKTMTDFVVSGNMKGSLLLVATNKYPGFPSLTFFFLCHCVKLTQTRFILLSSHCVNTQFSLTHKRNCSTQQNTSSFTTHVHSLLSIVFSFRQADDPLTFKTVFSFNPSYLVDKYFALWPSESHRWIKEGDKEQ